jgi:hypothetical protein
MKVVVSRPLTRSLGEAGALELAHQFKIYKSDQDNEYGQIFGRDKDFHFPEAVVRNGLQHVHMEEPAVENRWQAEWERNGPQENYTSDTILVYGRIPNQDYPPKQIPIMLVDLLTPSGHAKMKDIDGMRALGMIFEDEVSAYSVRLPTDKWIEV